MCLKSDQRESRLGGLEPDEICCLRAHEVDMRKPFNRMMLAVSMIGDGTQAIPEAHNQLGRSRRMGRRPRFIPLEEIAELSELSPERIAMVNEAARDSDILSRRVSIADVRERYGLSFEELVLALDLAAESAA